MNVEQLNALVESVSKDLSECQSVSLLTNLVNSLQNQINQPQQPNHQQAVSKARQSLNENLTSSLSNEFSPVWREMLEEIGGDRLVGDSLRDDIEEVFTGNEITTTIALDELREILSELEAFSNGIDSLKAGFRAFELGVDDLDPGESEIAITIPRAAVSEELLNFSKELKEIDQIITPFEIFSTGTSSGRRIRSISSSDLSVFLDSAPAVAALIATAIERLVKLYKTTLEIRLAHKQLKESGVPKKDLKGVEQHANQIMSKGISKFVNELTKNKKFSDIGEKTESKTSLRHAMHKLAVRIDDGYGLSVRTGEPDVNERDSETARRKKEEHVQVIKNTAKTLTFKNTDGTKILSLPTSVKKSSKDEVDQED